MKKIAFFIVSVIAILCFVWYGYYQYKVKKSEIETNNLEYKDLYEKEITGNKLATIINKTLDSNKRNNIKQDENGKYIENDENSISIDIKFIDSDMTFPIESIYSNNMSEFIRLYGQANFKCTKLEYHSSTKFIKYLYFEEI